MRWALTLSGDRRIGVESREWFLRQVDRFRDGLQANGYRSDFMDYTLDVEGDLRASVDLGPLTHEGLESVEEEVPEGVVEPTLGERIAQLHAARGAGEHLSQREMAAILGVTRYQIKKALR